MKVIIIEDERAAVRNLISLLNEVRPEAEIVTVIDSVAGTLEWFAEHPLPDLLFMDIHLADGSAFEIFEHIPLSCPIIFTTAYDEYALKAFEIGAIDYVLKPFADVRIEQTIARLRRYQANDRQQAGERVDDILLQVSRPVSKLPVEKSGKISLIDYENILYAYTSRGCVRLVTKETELEYQGSLAELEEKLRGSMLRRVHKSYLVNLSQVSEVIPWFKGTYWLKLAGGSATEIPVSKSQIKTIKALLGL